MRIAIVTHAFVKNDGQGRVNFEVVRGLVAAGHQVDLIAGRVDPALLALPGVRWTEVSHGPLPTNLLRNAWFSRQAARALEDLRDKVDLVVANGAITSAAVDVNAVHFVHGGWAVSPYFDPGKGLRGLYQRLYTWVNARLERRAFARAGRIVAVSGQVAGEVAALGVPREKIEVIANGVDVAAFSPEGEKAALEVPEGVVRALFVGDIVSRRKGLDTVLAAMPGIVGLHLVVAGRTEASPYPEFAKAAGLSENVTFLGFRRDVPEIMRACNLFVFPSRYEPFGLVILEALSCGLPAVTTRAAGIVGSLGPDILVALDDPDDMAALREALERLVSDPALRARMGAKGREAALSLTWDRMGARYVALFEDVLAQKRGEGEAMK
ncbi:MAG: glycosyltransferase family 1 protein [Rhodobacteraceae bacterium]|nr:MAG: glycosyltransferase family 1 protein [Paracoccaceae bacterium]